MGDLLSKYELLDAEGKRQLMEYLDLLLSKRKRKKAKFNVEAYRESLMKVGIWSEQDLAVFDEIRQHANQWTVKEW